MKNYKVVFEPSFKEAVVEEGTSILNAARMANVYIESHCNGKSACGKCRIRIVDGSPGPISPNESKFINQHDKEHGYRLACSTPVSGDMTVLITGDTILNSVAVEKLFFKRFDQLDPIVRGFRIELPAGKKETRSAYFEEIKKLLGENFGISNLICDLNALQSLQSAFRENNNKATVFIWMEKELIHVRPGWDDTCLGLALDIGTTTVALYLCDLQTGEIIASGSVTNPQIIFGEEIMSRIVYSIDHPRVGTQRMQAELVQSVNMLLDRMMAGKGFSSDRIMDMTVVGNTVMHHIFLGIAPDHLGHWPFIP